MIRKNAVNELLEQDFPGIETDHWFTSGMHPMFYWNSSTQLPVLRRNMWRSRLSAAIGDIDSYEFKETDNKVVMKDTIRRSGGVRYDWDKTLTKVGDLFMLQTISMEMMMGVNDKWDEIKANKVYQDALDLMDELNMDSSSDEKVQRFMYTYTRMFSHQPPPVGLKPELKFTQVGPNLIEAEMIIPDGIEPFWYYISAWPTENIPGTNQKKMGSIQAYGRKILISTDSNIRVDGVHHLLVPKAEFRAFYKYRDSSGKLMPMERKDEVFDLSNMMQGFNPFEGVV